jgi:hypothetical protein
MGISAAQVHKGVQVEDAPWYQARDAQDMEAGAGFFQLKENANYFQERPESWC